METHSWKAKVSPMASPNVSGIKLTKGNPAGEFDRFKELYTSYVTAAANLLDIGQHQAAKALLRKGDHLLKAEVDVIAQQYVTKLESKERTIDFLRNQLHEIKSKNGSDKTSNPEEKEPNGIGPKLIDTNSVAVENDNSPSKSQAKGKEQCGKLSEKNKKKKKRNKDKKTRYELVQEITEIAQDNITHDDQTVEAHSDLEPNNGYKLKRKHPTTADSDLELIQALDIVEENYPGKTLKQEEEIIPQKKKAKIDDASEGRSSVETKQTTGKVQHDEEQAKCLKKKKKKRSKDKKEVKLTETTVIEESTVPNNKTASKQANFTKDDPLVKSQNNLELTKVSKGETQPKKNETLHDENNNQEHVPKDKQDLELNQDEIPKNNQLIKEENNIDFEQALDILEQP